MAQAPKDENGLTPKQEAFCLAYLETGNATQAYRTAYDISPDARDHWHSVEACQLLDNPNITLRLEKLREEAEKLALFNVLKASEEYEEARQVAKKTGSASAMVSATQGKVKLFGLEAPVVRKHEHTGKDGAPIATITAEMSAEEAERAYADSLNNSEG